MSIAEFIRSIPKIGSFSHTERIKLFAWYLLRYENKAVFTSADISKCFDGTNLARPSDVSPFLHSLEQRKPKVLIRNGKGFALEHNAVADLDKRFGERPSAAVVRSGLKDQLSKITDPALRDYLTETIGCFEHGYFRASMVMGWCAGYAIFKQWLFSKHLIAFNAQMASWKDPKVIARIEDFQELNERTVLDTARKATATTREEDKQLVRLLEDRNSFAHPSGRKTSQVFAEAYLIQIIDEVVAKFS